MGDFEDRDVTKEKHVYDIHITEETTGTMAAEDVSGKPLEVKNTRTKGKIKIYKKDADSHLPIPQGNAVLLL